MLNKKGIKGIIGIILCAIVLVVLLSRCGGSPIIGQWEAADAPFMSLGYGTIKKLEFFSDGTYNSNHPNYSGSYSIEGNRLKISGILVSSETFSFKVRGNTLSLYHPENEEYVYEFKRVE